MRTSGRYWTSTRNGGGGVPKTKFLAVPLWITHVLSTAFAASCGPVVELTLIRPTRIRTSPGTSSCRPARSREPDLHLPGALCRRCSRSSCRPRPRPSSRRRRHLRCASSTRRGGVTRVSASWTVTRDNVSHDPEHWRRRLRTPEESGHVDRRRESDPSSSRTSPRSPDCPAPRFAPGRSIRRRDSRTRSARGCADCAISGVYRNAARGRVPIASSIQSTFAGAADGSTPTAMEPHASERRNRGDE